MLFAHGVPFRPGWENVVTPLVDFLPARPDVDPRRIALAGISQAGYWVPRALAFEHRITAAVADPE
ncbi:alpha/beta hydrolase family protein [Streptomyces sp. NPDC004059]